MNTFFFLEMATSGKHNWASDSHILSLLLTAFISSQKTELLYAGKKATPSLGHSEGNESNIMSEIMHIISFHHRRGKAFYESLGIFLRTISQQLIKMILIVQSASPCIKWLTLQPLPFLFSQGSDTSLLLVSTVCLEPLQIYYFPCLAHFGTLSSSQIPITN